METETMPATEAHGLARVVRSFAILSGVGASLGIGLGVLRLGDQVVAFAADNSMSMAKRQVLLKLLFACLVALPSLVGLAVLMQVYVPDRLRRFERAATALAPWTVVGLCPLLFHSTLWKGKPELFLLANLCCLLFVWGSLGGQEWTRLGARISTAFYVMRRRIPAPVMRALPWFVLGVAILVAVREGLSLAAVVPVRAHRGSSALFTSLGALKRLGHAGFLALPFETHPQLSAPSNYSQVVVTTLTAAAALPIFAWARLRLGRLAGLLVALFYLAFPHLPVIGSNSPLPLGTGAVFFFAAAYAFEKGHLVVAVLFSLLLLAVHEQTALWLVCLGVYFSCEKAPRRGSLFLILLPLVYFGWVALHLLPSWHVESYGKAYRSLWSDGTPGLLPALLTLACNPSYALARLCGERELSFWLQLLVPFSLLPFRNSRWLLWVSPFVFFGVVSLGHFPRGDLSSPTISHLVVMGFAASILTLDEIRKGRRGAAGMWAALFTWGIALMATTYQLGCLGRSPL